MLQKQPELNLGNAMAEKLVTPVIDCGRGWSHIAPKLHVPEYAICIVSESQNPLLLLRFCLCDSLWVGSCLHRQYLQLGQLISDLPNSIVCLQVEGIYIA